MLGRCIPLTPALSPLGRGSLGRYRFFNLSLIKYACPSDIPPSLHGTFRFMYTFIPSPVEAWMSCSEDTGSERYRRSKRLCGCRSCREDHARSFLITVATVLWNLVAIVSRGSDRLISWIKRQESRGRNRSQYTRFQTSPQPDTRPRCLAAVSASKRHCGFAFKGVPVAYAEQCGDRIEDPSRSGSERRNSGDPATTAAPV